MPVSATKLHVPLEPLTSSQNIPASGKRTKVKRSRSKRKRKKSTKRAESCPSRPRSLRPLQESPLPNQRSPLQERKLISPQPSNLSNFSGMTRKNSSLDTASVLLDISGEDNVTKMPTNTQNDLQRQNTLPPLETVPSATSKEKPKKRKISVLSAVKPENQETEKELFMKSKFKYNPQFVYKNTVTEKSLQKHGNPPEKLLPIAIKIIETALKKHRSYDDYEDKAGGRKLTNCEILDIVRTFLKEEHMNEVQIQISSDLVARAAMTRIKGQPTIQIQSGNIREKWISGMLRHEIGTHYIRGINNRQQTWRLGKKRRELNMAPMNPTEEGLASLNTVVLRDEPCLIRAAMLYYTVTKAASLSFCELFHDLGKYIKNPHTRWDYCLRAKRGYEDTSQPGAFQKDQVYLKGLLPILKHRESLDFHALFRLGKVCITDIERLKELGEFENTRLPSFVEDVDHYRKCLTNIMKKNGITDKDLEAVD